MQEHVCSLQEAHQTLLVAIKTTPLTQPPSQNRTGTEIDGELETFFIWLRSRDGFVFTVKYDQWFFFFFFFLFKKIGGDRAVVLEPGEIERLSMAPVSPGLDHSGVRSFIAVLLSGKGRFSLSSVGRHK